MNVRIDPERLLERFVRYAKIETTSQEDAERIPSSDGQWNLARMLVGELEALGAKNVKLEDHCYVYGLLPENLPSRHPRAGKVPVVGLIAHLDVSPAVSGKDVKPTVHRNYDGAELRLPGDPSIVLGPKSDSALTECKGCTIITSDGTTLLGADDKAGVAIIMTLLETLKGHPEIEHGPLAVAFTPDEEVGHGVDAFNLDAFGAEAAYTIDGEGLGEIEDETFCADSLVVTIRGINVHPGYAKGKMVNAIKVAADLVSKLPRDRLSPETTEGRQGYVHPYDMRGNEEQAIVKFLLRDFQAEGLSEQAKTIQDLARTVSAGWPGSQVSFEIKSSYRNMKEMLARRPELVRFAEEAVRAVGVEVRRVPIRGGTDGARLSFMGLPTPNVFTGGHNFHGKREWVVLEHMVKSVEALGDLVRIWTERGEKKGRLPAA